MTGEGMSAKLAVMFVHGVEISDPHFADTATRLLRQSFKAETGIDPDDALVIKPAYWAPVVNASQDQLLDSIGGGGGETVLPLFEPPGYGDRRRLGRQPAGAGGQRTHPPASVGARLSLSDTALFNNSLCRRRGCLPDQFNRAGTLRWSARRGCRDNAGTRGRSRRRRATLRYRAQPWCRDRE